MNFSKNNVLAVVVLYNPCKKLLFRLLNSLFGQVSGVCIIDNTPSPSDDIEVVCRSLFLEATYIALNENKGIAIAQNEGIKYGCSNGFEHVLLLDQDSFLPPNMVSELLVAESKLINSGINVAAVGPSFLDEKTGEVSCAIKSKFMRVERIPINTNSVKPVLTDYVIASGSLIRLSVLNEIGKMREDLFIDWVDVEWGERSAYHGYQSFIIPHLIMRHSIGDETVKSFGRNINLHSDFRNYFIVRNAVRLLFSKFISLNSKSLFFIKVPQYVVFYSIHSKRKLYSFFLLIRAVYDGLIGNMYKGFFK